MNQPGNNPPTARSVEAALTAQTASKNWGFKVDVDFDFKQVVVSLAWMGATGPQPRTGVPRMTEQQQAQADSMARVLLNAKPGELLFREEGIGRVYTKSLPGGYRYV